MFAGEQGVSTRGRDRTRRRKLGAIERRNLRLGLLFISPWIIGFLAFLVYPILSSLYYSFTDYSGFGEADWVGLSNFSRMMSDDLFWKSLGNTLYYTALAVPIGVVVAIILALAMNQPLREVAIYRAALYLPSVLPIFALAFIFIWILNPRFGLVNHVLNILGFESINWLGDPTWAKLSIVLLAQLGAGQYALVFLTSMRTIPTDLYDAAMIDGAGGWRRFRNITIPLITPIILYDIIVGISLGLQVFTPAYVMTAGGPDNATLFYVLYLYRQAFRYGDMGYASAMGWVLLLISLVLALIVFRTSRRWVHYEMD
ncbi:MAG TPA: sugar ABC transporter permease [Actinomycetota bacterium]|nr:sugar ABC transporter permease [Actinomycetota bacterium]